MKNTAFAMSLVLVAMNIQAADSEFDQQIREQLTRLSKKDIL